MPLISLRSLLVCADIGVENTIGLVIDEGGDAVTLTSAWYDGNSACYWFMLECNIGCCRSGEGICWFKKSFTTRINKSYVRLKF